MDSLYWSKLNPNVIVEPTTKQFYGQYVCKVSIDCPGGRLILKKTGNIQSLLAYRLANERSKNYGGSWRFNYYKLNEANVDQLERMRDVYNDYKSDVKIRIEEPNVCIYTKTVDDLKVFIAAVGTQYDDKLRLIQIPESDAHLQLLKEDKIILKKNSVLTYKYRVTIRDGEYDIETKQRIYDYLKSLDDIRIPQHTEMMLLHQFRYTWGSFFYINDPGVTTFLTLIDPKIVGKIHELASVDQ